MAKFKYKDEWKLYQKESKLDDQYYTQQQKQLNEWNMESAQKQMDFQKEMSDTSHQREVKDLLKAGLNPVLSANNGASTPSGAYANIDSTPLTAASQSRMANRQMRQNMIENKMQLRNAMAIAKYQARMQYAAQKYAADMSYKLGLAGFSNQMEMAMLPYQDGNVNQTTKYQVDANPISYFTNLITGLVEDNIGVSSSKGVGQFVSKLLNNKVKYKGQGSSFLMKENANALAQAFADKIKYMKNYNIRKKDYLKSMHEYARGNWSYESEKWLRDHGYIFDKKQYK